MVVINENRIESILNQSGSTGVLSEQLPAPGVRLTKRVRIFDSSDLNRCCDLTRVTDGHWGLKRIPLSACLSAVLEHVRLSTKSLSLKDSIPFASSSQNDTSLQQASQA
jgi:hypothetical protein